MGKWAKVAQTVAITGFQLGQFQNKSGPKPKKSGPKYLFRLNKPYQNQQNPNKSGPNPKIFSQKWAKKKSLC